MGFFDSFKSGAKDVFKGYDKVKLNDKITYDELYEIMKDETYSVGKPEITGSGLMRCIQFPAVDKYKIQIAITSKTITISKIYSGAGGLAKEIIGDAFTNGMYDIGGTWNRQILSWLHRYRYFKINHLWGIRNLVAYRLNYDSNR